MSRHGGDRGRVRRLHETTLTPSRQRDPPRVSLPPLIFSSTDSFVTSFYISVKCCYHSQNSWNYY